MLDYNVSQGIDEKKCACNCANEATCVAYHFDNAENASICGLYKNLGDIVSDANSSAYVKKAAECDLDVECTL